MSGRCPVSETGLADGIRVGLLLYLTKAADCVPRRMKKALIFSACIVSCYVFDTDPFCGGLVFSRLPPGMPIEEIVVLMSNSDFPSLIHPLADLMNVNNHEIFLVVEIRQSIRR
jgi:hypothetical protein